MSNRAAKLRNRIQQRDPGASVVSRTRTGVIHRLSNGRFSSDTTIGPIHYWDDIGEAHEIDTMLVETDPGVFDVANAEFGIEVRRNGNRRVYPRKRDGEFIEFGAPQYRDGVSSGPWRNFDWTVEGQVSDDRILWDGPDASLIVRIMPTGVKVDLVIKTSEHNRPIRWPRSLHGMIRDLDRPAVFAFKSVFDDTTVLFMPEPFVTDSSAEPQRVDIAWDFGAQFVTYQPFDDTALVYPVTIDPTVDSFQVAASSDDGVWVPGIVFDASGQTVPNAFGFDDVSIHAFWRYAGVTVDPDAVVHEAHLTHTATGSTSGALTVDISAHDADNPNAPTSLSEAENAPRTGAVNWTPPGFTADQTHDTDDISALIESIVQRPGWSSGNAMVLFHEHATGSTVRAIYGYHQDPDKATVLHIEWQEPSAEPDVPDNFSLTTIDHESATANWDTTDDTTHYNVRWDTDSNFTDPTVLNDIGDPPQPISNLPANTQVWAQVQACNAGGCSDWSTADSATTDPLPVTIQPAAATASADAPLPVMTADVWLPMPVNYQAVALDHETVRDTWEEPE